MFDSLPEDINVTVVPAAPGWSVLVPFTASAHDDTVVEFGRDSIVAWRIETTWTMRTERFDSYTYPITVEQLCRDRGEILERPDGRIVFVDDCEFGPDAEANALAHENDKRLRARARAEARKDADTTRRRTA